MPRRGLEVVEAGDLFLVASDGLTGMVDDMRLQVVLGSRSSPGRLVDALINEANGRGGLDNITAVVVQVLSTDDPRLDAPTGENPAYDGGSPLSTARFQRPR